MLLYHVFEFFQLLLLLLYFNIQNSYASNRGFSFRISRSYVLCCAPLLRGAFNFFLGSDTPVMTDGYVQKTFSCQPDDRYYLLFWKMSRLQIRTYQMLSASYLPVLSWFEALPNLIKPATSMGVQPLLRFFIRLVLVLWNNVWQKSRSKLRLTSFQLLHGDIALRCATFTCVLVSWPGNPHTYMSGPSSGQPYL